MGSSGQSVEILAVAGALKVFYHCPSGSESADQQSPVQHREQTGNTGLGRSFLCSALLERGNIETETADPSGYCCLPTLDFTFACAFLKNWDTALFGEITNSKEANSQ